MVNVYTCYNKHVYISHILHKKAREDRMRRKRRHRVREGGRREGEWVRGGGGMGEHVQMRTRSSEAQPSLCIEREPGTEWR